MQRFHITNGDAAAERIRDSVVPGDVLPWRDVLHEGPVPAGLEPEHLRAVRARFIAGCGWGGSFEQVLSDFEARDARLARFDESPDVTLWFEHDLYDQLQLLQLLAWFASRSLETTRLSLICIGEYPGVDDFRGLGQLTPEQIGGLDGSRHAISRAQLDLGRKGWEAFGSDNPHGLESLLEENLGALPFLRAAVRRLLEQYPGSCDGLSRTERQILQAADNGARRLADVFRASQYDMEESPFLGDSSFLRYARELCDAGLLDLESGSLLTSDSGSVDRRLWEQEVRLPETGRKVLAAQADRVALCGIDRWVGGVHLQGKQVTWRWNATTGKLVPGRSE